MSSPSTGTQHYEISDLPPEVFPKIFKHLSVHERKVMKFVCKSWFEACNVLPLLDDEVLTCRGIYQLSDIYELLDKSERKFLNLKFENVQFDDGSSFWKNNGPRIRSIDFHDCQFPNGILEEIIIYSQHLYHLSFTYTPLLQCMVKDKNSLPPIKDLEKVSAKGFVHKNLSSLEIDIINSNWMRLSDHIIHQLFLIFPKIKILKITSDFCFCPAQNNHVDLSEHPSNNRVSMSPVLNFLIASAEQIEKLKLDFPSAEFSPDILRFILETVFSLNRLTELCIATRNTIRIEDIGTFVYSKQLKSLEFGIHMKSCDIMLFLSQLLHSNSSLQYLEINRCWTSLIVTKPFFEKLISSCIKSFVVTASEVSLQDADTFGSCLSTQNRSMVLPSLSVCMTFSQADILQFLQYYRNLHHLARDNISQNELQLLFKHQKELKSLKICSEQWMEFYEIGPDDFKNGFNQLTNIEYLELTNAPLALYFLRTLSPEPILAKLKYLRIDVQFADEMLFPSDLLKLSKAVPFLEALCVHNGGSLPYNVCVELCTKLSRLRFLSLRQNWLVDDGILTDEHCHKLFSICTSLRVLIHAKSSKIDTYFLDTINNKVVLKLDENRCHLDIPRVGEFTFSWLEF